MICKIKKAVVPEPWGSPPRSGGEECFWSILGLFFPPPFIYLFIYFWVGGLGEPLRKSLGPLEYPWGYFRGSLFFLGVEMGRGEMILKLWGLRGCVSWGLFWEFSGSEPISPKLSLSCLTCAPSGSQREALDPGEMKIWGTVDRMSVFNQSTFLNCAGSSMGSGRQS